MKTLFDKAAIKMESKEDMDKLLTLAQNAHLELDFTGKFHYDENGIRVVDEITGIRGVSWVANE